MVPRGGVRSLRQAPSMTTMSANTMVSPLMIHCQQAHFVAQFEAQCIVKHMYRRMPLEARIRVTEGSNELSGKCAPPTLAHVRWAGWGRQGHTPPTRILYMAAATDQVRGGVNHLLISRGDAAGLMRLLDTYPQSTKTAPNS